MTLTKHEIEALALDIYVGGDIEQTKQVCREYVNEVGLCVTVEPVEFIYTKGQESGVRVGLKSYPRFPEDAPSLWLKAHILATNLIAQLFQTSAMICGPDKHVWITEK